MNKLIKVSESGTASTIRGRILLFAGALLIGAAGTWLVLGNATPVRADAVVVKLTPWCGCCGGWVEYMKGAGFSVRVVEIEDIEGVKQAAAVPEDFYSCHTSEVAGYVVEGHVPLSAVEKLLSERPSIDGIALAGMPSGSPGMGGERWPSYPVEAFRDGRPHGLFMDAPLN
jgi:hypothetical protein